MTKINLLPWREERRQELKRQFFTTLVGALFIGAGMVYLWYMNVQSQIEYQNSRNQYVVNETKKLEQQIKEIEELKNKRASLVDRMRVIQNLQGNRPVVVKIFDELARTVPDGVFYQVINSTDNNIKITGFAESNNRVSNLMRNLDGSPLLAEPNLSKVLTSKDADAVNKFDLTVTREAPAEDDEDGQG